MTVHMLVEKYVMNNIRLKVLALIIAIMLWASMTYMGESKIVVSVPVSFENLPKSMVVTESNTKNVLITVNGPLSALKSLRLGDIRVPIDLVRTREGRHIFTIRKGDVIVPGGMKIEDLKPDYIVAEIDKIVEKNLRTVVKLDKKWARIYEIRSWYPRYVEVEGPRELLEKRNVVETFPVDGDFTEQQEVLDVPFNAKSLEAKKVRPETARVTLRRIGK